MRILIVSYLFAPYNCIGSVRVSKMAKWLERFGHEVKVLTSSDQQFGQLLIPSLPLEIKPEKITYTPWFDHMRFKVRTGNDFEPGEGKTNHSTAQAAKTKHNSLYIMMRKMYFNVAAFPDEVVGWLPYAERAADNILADWKPDVIYSSGWPVTSLVISSRISRKHKIPYVAELRDPWSDYYFTRIPKWRIPFDRMLERRTLSSASGLIGLTEKHRDQLAKTYGIPSECVGNGYDIEDYPSINPDYGDKSELNICYFGTFYDQYNPSLIFNAVKSLLERGLQVKMTFYTTSPQLVEDAAARSQVSDVVRSLPVVSRKKALELQMSSDILLMMMIPSEATKAKFTGKIYDYLGSQRPILCVGYDESAGAMLVNQLNAGFVSSDKSKIASQLESWLEIKKTNGAIPNNQYSGMNCFTREAQAKKLDNMLRSIVDAS